SDHERFDGWMIAKNRINGETILRHVPGEIENRIRVPSENAAATHAVNRFFRRLTTLTVVRTERNRCAGLDGQRFDFVEQAGNVSGFVFVAVAQHFVTRVEDDQYVYARFDLADDGR